MIFHSKRQTPASREARLDNHGVDMNTSNHKGARVSPIGGRLSAERISLPHLASGGRRSDRLRLSGFASLVLMVLVAQLMWWNALHELLPPVVRIGLLAATVLIFAVLVVIASVDADLGDASTEAGKVAADPGASGSGQRRAPPA
ncbi:hypothetical protein PY365_03655 [Roseiarcaceae bacterium H3SJ34-1]|uniref:hypothetical protein n=1 Tax=Terripilifer ovatus TaxID=3032367 RepID=UPI003AB9321E|nr:hypothetical protein [Roseiarcaceae bacterium H3SJ34-1]